MLAFHSNKEDSTGLQIFFGGNSPKSNGGLIAKTTSLLSTPDGGGYDTCSFYTGPSDAAIVAFCESGECCGSIAYGESGESAGSIASAGGGECCGSIASSGGGSFSGGDCC